MAKTRTIRVDKEVKRIIDARRDELRLSNPKTTRNDALRDLLLAPEADPFSVPILGTSKTEGPVESSSSH